MASLGAGAATPVSPVLTIPTAPSAGAATRGSDESMHTLDILDAASMRSDVPDFRPGDTLKVHVRVVEGNRERVQIFQGVVIRRQGGGVRETFTVRKVSFGVGVERTFPVHTHPAARPVAALATGGAEQAGSFVTEDGRGSPVDSSDRGAATAAAGDQPPRAKRGSFLRELPFLLLVAFLLALLIKAFLVQAFYIPSGSMERTLLIGDRVLVNKVVYRIRDVHRGEVVVFKGPDTWAPEVVLPEGNGVQRALRGLARVIGVGPPGEKDFIKRVVGLPGDTVTCCTNGQVTVQAPGQPPVALDEPYLYDNNPPPERAFPPVAP